MANAKTVMTYEEDGRRYAYVFVNPKRNITVAEIRDKLREKGQFGAYAIIVKVGEDKGYQGWGDESADVVAAYELYDGGDCPICSSLLVVDCCPKCGAELRKTIEGREKDDR